MKKTVTKWAVFDPEGEPIEWTLLSNPIWCKEFFAEYRPVWKDYEKQGYTCRKVRVTIEEIKNEK